MENIDTTKTWKQKTKSVGLAALIGLTTAFTGIGGLATPASAGGQANNRICNLQVRGVFYILKHNEDTTASNCNEIYTTNQYTGNNIWWYGPNDPEKGEECDDYSAYLDYDGDVCLDMTGMRAYLLEDVRNKDKSEWQTENFDGIGYYQFYGY